MIQMFQELGEYITAKWDRSSWQIDAFPRIATAALNDSKILETIRPENVIEWLSRSNDIPDQYLKDFGQPPINVYVSDRFYIQVLFWIDGTTAIHEHSFSGAFGVLAGGSVHSRYDFELTNPLSKELQIGKVKFISSELLKRGNVRTINAGDKFIHALFHLDRPSVSVVVRTRGETSRQFSYLKPHVAYDAFHDDKTIATKVRMLDSLRIMNSEMFWQYCGACLAESSAWALLHLLNVAYQKSTEEPAAWNELVKMASARHGEEIVRAVIASIEEDSKGKKISRLRSTIHDHELRFFLALLLNVPDRKTMLTLIEERFDTEDPGSLVLRWIKEMSDRGLFRAKADPALLEVIGLAMHYATFDEAKSKKGAVNVDDDKLKQLWHAARSIEFLQPLFR